MVSRMELTEKIRSIKRVRKLSWKQISAEISTSSPICITAALLGQMSLRAKEAAKAAKLLGLSEEEELMLAEAPHRGSLPSVPPTDPLIYRFHELVQVYGTTWKALIEEEFGNGIMSAIDFNMKIEREPDPKGDRVNITMSESFCPTSATDFPAAIDLPAACAMPCPSPCLRRGGRACAEWTAQGRFPDG